LLALSSSAGSCVAICAVLAGICQGPVAQAQNISTVVGNGTSGYSGDGGPATSAALNQPFGIAFDASGNLYIADQYNCLIREVSGGIITTIAGNTSGAPNCGYSGDGGPATSAQLNLPTGVTLDSSGNLYIVDYGNCVVRKVNGGTITTIAGSASGCGYSGDGGPATSAQLQGPVGLTLDSSGNLYIADTYNCLIREVSGGVITTVAGNSSGAPNCGYSGDGGPATSAQLNDTYGIAIDSAGNLYIADEVNCLVREVSGGIITAIAGNTSGVPNCWYTGDGAPATTFNLSFPQGITPDPSGNLYIADT
jgi:sugar lactone lactonase YvrE